MAFVNDSALDAALSWIQTNGTTLHICSSEPASYAGIAAVELASAPITIGSPADRSPNGREVTVPAVSADAVDTSGNSTHYAISNGTDTLVATNATAGTVALSDTGTYNTSTFTIGLPDFVSE